MILKERGSLRFLNFHFQRLTKTEKHAPRLSLKNISGSCSEFSFQDILRSMKELILFVTAVLFIACQNLSVSNTSTPSESSISALSITAAGSSGQCQNQEVDTLDIVKELENPENPGFYHREQSLRSELKASEGNKEWVCISNVTNTEEETAATSPVIPQQETGKWDVLIEKWTWVPETRTSQDSEAQKLNPVCRDFDHSPACSISDVALPCNPT